jgi:holo-[acyl-carrier protein] synthase
MADDDVVGSALEVLAIDDALPLTRDGGDASAFSEGERAYAYARSDPDRRLAARLAAKRAALRLLGEDLALRDVEVVRGRGGPPRLELSARAEERLRALGARATRVSLTHERRHAAASVLLLRGRG